MIVFLRNDLFINFMLYMFSYISNGFSTEVLDIIIGTALFSGIFIIISKNPIVSVLHLISLFASISCFLIFIGLKFIGISYLLVYVGAVSILFIFILMLINIRVSELIDETNNNIPLALIAIVAIFIPYNKIIPDVKPSLDQASAFMNILKDKIYYVSSCSWDGYLVDISDITSIGNVMFTSYALWLILTSFILLLAMVGSIVITIKIRNM